MIMEWQIMLLKIYQTACVGATYAEERYKGLETCQKRKSSNTKDFSHHTYRKLLQIKLND